MTTIREYLIGELARSAAARLEKLEALDAPAVIVENERKKATDPAGAVDRYGKIKQFGGLEITSAVWKKGKMGRPYCRFTIEGQPGAYVCFVQGKFGWYLYQEDK